MAAQTSCIANSLALCKSAGAARGSTGEAAKHPTAYPEAVKTGLTTNLDGHTLGYCKVASGSLCERSPQGYAAVAGYQWPLAMCRDRRAFRMGQTLA